MNEINTAEVKELVDSYLSDEQACLFDGHCGEPVVWGKWLPYAKLPEDIYASICKIYGTRCTDSYPSRWLAVTKVLTPEEAIEKYGPITEVEVGPRGGFKTVTYGEKKFCMRDMCPDDSLHDQSVVKVLSNVTVETPAIKKLKKLFK